ncbi:MAG: SUMF1/EgtB/PvdO family nonheme iron enzyme [Treponema sp.]|jgi:hypothetical protein|nr:SUMF1/EgtB/PvdO family nonheme iron enzyme [Treponema sp.]
MQEKQANNDDSVKLKPLYGMRPGVYLTLLYSIILLIILFFLLLFPGLKSPGAVLIVKTEPAGAGIRVNGVYMGISGSAIPVPKGLATITAVLPGFNSESAVHEIPAHYFGSLFFPLRYRVEMTLKTDDPSAAFAISAADFADWSFGGEPTASWQIPLSLSTGAYRAGTYTVAKEELQDILLAASRFTVTRAALRDLLRAKILLDNNGLSPSPASLLGSVSDITAFLSENQGSAKWLCGLLPPEIASKIKASEWYKNEAASLSEPQFAAASSRNLPVNRLELSGLYFTAIPARIMTKGGSSETINSFLISETPVSRQLFQIFLNENPQWREQQTDYYPDEISVYPSETYGNGIITGVTWYAAQAFCSWLSGRLPASLSAMEVRLPTEDEWLSAAQTITGMRNPGWEWCADPYAPLNFISAPTQAVNAVGSPERSLRGRPSSTSTVNRASLPPELSSPFVTFRPIIAERK